MCHFYAILTTHVLKIRRHSKKCKEINKIKDIFCAAWPIKSGYS